MHERVTFEYGFTTLTGVITRRTPNYAIVLVDADADVMAGKECMIWTEELEGSYVPDRV